MKKTRIEAIAKRIINSPAAPRPPEETDPASSRARGGGDEAKMKNQIGDAAAASPPASRR